MALQMFTVSQTNPNNTAGCSGGCVCSPNKASRCEPPYAVFYGTEMHNHLSPYPVLSLACAARFVAGRGGDPAAAAPVAPVKACVCPPPEHKHAPLDVTEIVLDNCPKAPPLPASPSPHVASPRRDTPKPSPRKPRAAL